MKPAARILFLVVFLASLSVNLSWAQTFTGTFVGIVADATGAVMPNAKVTVTNLDTGLERVVSTDSTGNYAVPLLPPGEYRITVEMPAFKRAIRERVSLQVNQELRVDFTLSPGELVQEVVVTEAVPLVQTETATVGTVVTQREVLELPLNGRNFLQLNLLVPGAMPGAKGSQLGTQGGSINVHGLRESSNFFWLDGIDNTTMAIGQLVVNPPTYSVQEFKVQSPTYSAEFGRTAGAQINIITRSGKNTFHGDAYEFLRNDALDAKNFFDAPGKIPKFRRNQFGFDLGGPIVRDQTFFFAGYEGIRERRARTFTAKVPPPAMVGGDFSSLNPNPMTCADPGAICDPTTSDPFPGNIIPSSRLDSIGAALASAYPAPNNPSDPQRNLITNPVHILNDDSVVAKVDHQLTKNDHLFGRYNFQNINALDPVNLFGRTTNIPGYGRKQPATRFQTFGVSDTHTFSPRVVGEFRFGWNRWKLDYVHQDQGDDVAGRLGIPGLSTEAIDLGFPLLVMGGAFDNLGSATNLPQHGPFDTYHWAGTVSYVTGKQTWKFGGSYYYFVSDFFLDAVARGQFIFTGAFSRHPFADLLLGLPTVSVRGVGKTDFLFVSRSVSFFAQDDWRLRPNLTLTLGLRYEYNVPVIEKQDRMANFYPDTQTVVMAGQDASRATYEGDTNNFAPRVGLAWDLFGNGKWAMRWGYGIFYEIPVVNTQLGLRLNPPFFRVDIAFGDGQTVTMANAFANLATLTPNFSTFARRFVDGYVQQWSWNIQHELMPNFILDIGYVGTKGTHLYRNYNINQPLPGPGSIQSRRPFPQFGAMGTINSIASSIYHGLEVRAEKRFSHGLSFLAAYTFSKAIDDSSAQFGNFSDANIPQDSNNLRAERGLSNFHAQHRFILSYIYELPFGPRRRFGGDSSGFGGKLLEGWQLAGIATFQDGQPFTPVLAIDNSNTGQLLDRPNLVGDPYAPGPGCPRTRTPNCWVNPAAFAAPPPMSFGNAARGSLIGPGVNNVDFSLIKNTSLTETRMLQFRAEFFNIANHPNFDNPNRTALTPLFGQIFSADGIPSRQIQFGLRLIF